MSNVTNLFHGSKKRILTTKMYNYTPYRYIYNIYITYNICGRNVGCITLLYGSLQMHQMYDTYTSMCACMFVSFRIVKWLRTLVIMPARGIYSKAYNKCRKKNMHKCNGELCNRVWFNHEYMYMSFYFDGKETVLYSILAGTKNRKSARKINLTREKVWERERK